MLCKRYEFVHACVSLCLFDTCPLPITRFLWDYLTRVRYLLPHFCVFIHVRWLLSYFCGFNWHVSSACYQTFVGLFDTCPLAFIKCLCLFDTCRLPITRFMCLTRVRFLLPDLCMFIWHVSVSCYQISVCLFGTCSFLVTRFLYVYLTRVLFPLPDFCVCFIPIRFLVPYFCVYLTRVRCLLPEQFGWASQLAFWHSYFVVRRWLNQSSFCVNFSLIPFKLFFQVVIQWLSCHSTWCSPCLIHCLFTSK